MSAIRRAVNTPATQTERANPRQVKNAAGGYVYEVTDRSRLERFLILGTDGGTYYAKEQELTKQNLTVIDQIIIRDPDMAIHVTRDVSASGRAYRNTPAIYVAARILCTCDEALKGHARQLVNEVCRTSTHIFELCGFIDAAGGWGQAKMAAIRTWYESKPRNSLKYQAVKYRGGRYGWTHRDVLRTVHPTGLDERTVNFMLGKPLPLGSSQRDIFAGFEEMQNSKTAIDVLNVLSDFPGLPWETIPTQFLREPMVWQELFYNGQLNGQALLRNIRRMDEIGCFKDLSFAADVASAMVDPEKIRHARLHPIQYLNAMGACGLLGEIVGYYPIRNSSPSGKLSSGPVVDALEGGMYEAFGAVSDAQRYLLGVDVSGSMTWSGPAGLKNVTCAQAAAVMAMVSARANKASIIRGFSTTFKDLGITGKTSLKEAFRRVHDNNFGGTDVSLPMTWAAREGVQVDKFVVYTDGETWSGRRHVDQALRDYRQQTGIQAKLIIVGMTATDYTVGDTNDCGTLDVVGFDTSTPNLISNF